MKLGYVILYVPSVPEAVEFYEQAFELKCRFRHEDGANAYAEMDTGTTALAFASESLVDSHEFSYQKISLKDDPPAVEIGLVTDDVDAAYERAVAAGALAVKSPQEKPWGQIVSYVRDKHGFLIEICSPVGS